MTSPIKGNFGHIRESGVLLLTKEDSDMKHKRNAILAGLSFATLFSVGAGAPYLYDEAYDEREIRKWGRKFPDLPYSKCVELEKNQSVEYRGRTYRTFPIEGEPGYEEYCIQMERHREEMKNWKQTEMTPPISIWREG